MDITGPHPRSRNGNEYILTVVDLFSKWAEAFPIRHHTAPIVAKKLVDNIFVRFGVPMRLLSDQGPEFESTLMAELCRLLAIEKIRSSPYKPSTNGVCERFHRTLNSMIAKVICESQRDWDEHVPNVMSAYRATVHESTSFTPNYLVFGRENRMPIDVVLASDSDPKPNLASESEYAAELVDRLRTAHQQARECLKRSAETRKRSYDLKVKPVEFEVGQWVYYLYQRRFKGRSPKWTSAYTGPYRIVHKIPPCNVVLAKSKRSNRFVVHIDKLKPFCGEPPPSWPLAEGIDLAPIDKHDRPDEVPQPQDVEKQQEQDEPNEQDNDDNDDSISGADGDPEPSETESEQEDIGKQDNRVQIEVKSPVNTRPRRLIRPPVRYHDL